MIDSPIVDLKCCERAGNVVTLNLKGYHEIENEAREGGGWTNKGMCWLCMAPFKARTRLKSINKKEIKPLRLVRGE